MCFRFPELVQRCRVQVEERESILSKTTKITKQEIFDLILG